MTNDCIDELIKKQIQEVKQDKGRKYITLNELKEIRNRKKIPIRVDMLQLGVLYVLNIKIPKCELKEDNFGKFREDDLIMFTRECLQDEKDHGTAMYFTQVKEAQCLMEVWKLATECEQGISILVQWVRCVLLENTRVISHTNIKMIDDMEHVRIDVLNDLYELLQIQQLHGTSLTDFIQLFQSEAQSQFHTKSSSDFIPITLLSQYLGHFFKSWCSRLAQYGMCACNPEQKKEQNTISKLSLSL